MPDIHEYFEDGQEAYHAALTGFQRKLWTAVPVKVIKDSDGHTVALKPLVKGIVQDQKGRWKEVDLPELHDVPIKYPQGGGVVMTHPVKTDDEGIAIFSSRPFDKWWKEGGEKGQVNQRMHSLADGMYVPGIRSTPRKLSNVSQDSVQIRTDDGKSFAELKKDGHWNVSTEQPQTMVVKNATVKVEDGKITAEVDGMKIVITDKRINLGGDDGDTKAVLTVSGPSSKVFAIV